MSSPTPVPVPVQLDDLGDLIAAVPGILGFYPADSLVLATVTDPSAPTLGAAIRVDLPSRRHERRVAEQLTAAMMNNAAIAAVALIIGGAGGGGDRTGGIDAADPGELPGRTLRDHVAEVADRAGIDLVHSAWVPAIESGAVWRCFQHDDCAGPVPDPKASEVAAATVVDGAVTFASRAEMAAQLTPDPHEELARRSALLDEASGADPGGAAAGSALIADTIREIRDGDGAVELDDARIVALTRALSDPRVRDGCLSAALAGFGDAPERLWLALTRATPAPERAQPACLLALHAYLRGDGALTAMALDAALTADPGHRLAWLVRHTIDAGTPPDRVRALLTRAAGAPAGESTTGRIGHRDGPS